MERAPKLNPGQNFWQVPVFWQGPSERNESSNKISRKWERRLAVQMATKLANQDTSIVDLGASGCYFTPGAPVSNVNKTAAKIRVGTETGQAQTSEASCEFPLPDLPPGLFGHIIPGFTHNIFGIGNICDKYCKVLFTKQSGSIYDSNNQPFLKGWREASGAKLRRISLRPDLRPDLAKFSPSKEDTKADSQEK